MSIEVHIDWEGNTHWVGLLRPAARGATVTFEYHPTWLSRRPAMAPSRPTPPTLRRDDFGLRQRLRESVDRRSRLPAQGVIGKRKRPAGRGCATLQKMIEPDTAPEHS